jgi:hypothetical protein
MRSFVVLFSLAVLGLGSHVASAVEDSESIEMASAEEDEGGSGDMGEESLDSADYDGSAEAEPEVIVTPEPEWTEDSGY